MFRLLPHARHDALGCCLGLSGLILGGVIGHWTVSRQIAAELAKDPDHIVCGNAYMGAVMASALLCSTASAALGVLVGRLWPGKR